MLLDKRIKKIKALLFAYPPGDMPDIRSNPSCRKELSLISPIENYLEISWITQIGMHILKNKITLIYRDIRQLVDSPN